MKLNRRPWRVYKKTNNNNNDIFWKRLTYKILLSLQDNRTNNCLECTILSMNIHVSTF